MLSDDDPDAGVAAGIVIEARRADVRNLAA
jgi:hypothetical protein